jgi:hypothetical protein
MRKVPEQKRKENVGEHSLRECEGTLRNRTEGEDSRRNILSERYK